MSRPPSSKHSSIKHMMEVARTAYLYAKGKTDTALWDLRATPSSERAYRHRRVALSDALTEEHLTRVKFDEKKRVLDNMRPDE